MKHQPNQVTENPARAILAVAVGCALIAGFVVASEIVLILFLGVLFGIFLSRVTGWISKTTQIGYHGSLALTVIGLLLLTAGSLAFFFVQINQQIELASERIDTGVEELRDLVDRYPAVHSAVTSIPFLGDALIDAHPQKSKQGKQDDPAESSAESPKVDLTKVPEPIQRAASTIGQLFRSTFGLAVNSLLIAFVGLFLAVSPSTYRDGAVSLVPPRRRGRATEVMNQVGDVLWKWLIGRFASMLLTGVGAFLLLLLIGVPMAATLGIVTGLFAFVPNIGAAISLMLAALFALPQGLGTVAMVLAAFVALQLLESYVVSPLIQQYQVSLPPALLISFQAVMGVLFGFLGAAVASPILAAGKTITQLVYVNDYLGDTPRDVD